MLDLPAIKPQAVFLDRMGMNDQYLPFELLHGGWQQGLRGALVTIVGIQGGAPRALGTQMAVLEDGRYCGYISGGCIESAVAAEAIRVIRQGVDEVIRFGAGSRFIDVQLPCGGGLDLRFTQGLDRALVDQALNSFQQRTPFTLTVGDKPSQVAIGPGQTSGDIRGFTCAYRPPVRLLLIGAGAEMLSLAHLGLAAGLPVTCLSSDEACLEAASRWGAECQFLVGSQIADHLMDPQTAVVFLFHDHDRELPLLVSALQQPCLYIGALGSKRTQERRKSLLEDSGVSTENSARLQGPIGMFGPTRDPTTTAVSVLADIAARASQ